jgi:autotransporter-associated beta strand protein
MKKNIKLLPAAMPRFAAVCLVAAAGWGGTGSVARASSLVWTGANSSDWDTATLNWVISGGGPATYADSDSVLFDDSTAINSINLNTAISPGGIVVSNNLADYTLGGGGYLTGGTGLTKKGTARLVLNNTGASDFTGVVNVGAGILEINLGTALGATNGATVVANGAQLLLDSQTALTEPLVLTGSGPDGSGALVNNSGGNAASQNLWNITLTGDTTIGDNAKMTIGGGAGADPALSSLSTGGHAYNLICSGSVAFCMGTMTVDPALGDILVQSGYFNVQYDLAGVGDPTRSFYISPGAHLYFFGLTHELEKNISLTGDGGSPSLYVGGPTTVTNRIGGNVFLNNDCIFDIGAGQELDLNGSVGGANLTQIHPGTVVVNGTMTNAGTIFNAGTLTLKGRHTGTITISSGATLNGTGTNSGFTDIYGALLPGGTNQPGTLTLGGLTLESGATLAVELAANNTVGSGVNDLLQVNGNLTVNGNAVTVNPLGLLQTGAAHPYRLANYTGSLIWNSDLVVTGPNGYQFTVDTNTPGQVNLIVSGGPLVWNGGSATGNNWSDAANWNNSPISAGLALDFTGTSRLNNTNDTAAGTSYGAINFMADAGSFVLNGNPLNLGGGVLNSSANPQTFNLGLTVSGNQIINGGTGGVVVAGGLTNTLSAPATAVVSLAGQGTLDDRIGSTAASGATNTLYVLTNANWTLLDNPDHTVMSMPLSLAVDGTFSFGATNSAPVVNATPVGVSGISGLLYDSVGTRAGTVGTMNVVGGILSLPNNGRLYVAYGANATGVLNVSGGALNLRGGLQCANANAGNQVAVVNVSGGLLNMGNTNTGTQQSIYLAATGQGTLNLSGSGVVSCVTFDVSGNQHGNTYGSVGTVNLNGGTLIANTVTTASANPQPLLTHGTAATFNFNGGTLKTRGTTPTVFQGNTTLPLPIAAVVQAGGAVLDSWTYGMIVNEPLQHDAALGGTRDGGLTKLGTGRLALTQPCTYTGPTLVNQGTLALTNSGTANASSPLIVASGALLDVSGMDSGFSVASGQTLAGRGRVNGDVVVGVGATLQPGAANAQLAFTNGTLVFSNSLTLVDGSTTVMGVNGGLNPSNTTAQVAGTVNFGGSLVITNFGAAPLHAGDTFKLFSATAYNGTFTNIAYPGGYTWTNSLATDGSITVLTVLPTLPTTPTNITFSVAGGALNLAWPASYRGWLLQVQTNDLQHGLGTNWVMVPGSDQVNSLSLPVGPANGGVFYRLAYPQ